MEGGLSMAVWNIVNRTDFRSHANIMAEHYQLERIRAEEYLKSISTYRIKDLYKEVIQIISPSKLEDSWNVYDLTDGISNFLTTEPHYTKSSSAKKVAVENDFVISRLRSYLKEMAVVPNCNYKMAFSTEYLVYRSKQSITASLLLPFSLSSYVQSILKWAQMGNEHPRFSSETFGDIFIPNCILAHSNEISAYIAEAIECQKQSQALYHQAETLLAKELQLDQLKLSNKKWYTTRYCEVVGNGRCDGEYYQPKYKQLMEHLSKFKCKALGSLCDFNKGFEIGSSSYKDHGKLFMRVSNISENGIHLGNSDKYLSDFDFHRLKLFQIEKGDVLCTKDGTIAMCYVIDEEIEGIFSSGIVKLSLNEEIPTEYLAIVINSVFGKMQANRDCSGALITHWKIGEMKKIQIPIIASTSMNTIADYVIQSKAAKRQSKQLLAQAKRRVEEMIEQEANKNK